MISCHCLSTLNVTGRQRSPTSLPLPPGSHPPQVPGLAPLPEMPKAPADPSPQGRAPALTANQEPVWPGPHLHFQQEVLSVDSERY